MSREPISERDRLLRDLATRGQDFTGTFLAVHGLSTLLARTPELANEAVVRALDDVLTRPTHQSQSKALFMYRMAAEGLSLVLNRQFDSVLARQARSVCSRIIAEAKGKVLMATSEALGSLPVITGTALPGPERPETRDLAPLEPLLAQHRIPVTQVTPRIVGRSLVFTLGAGGLLVIKMLRRSDSLGTLLKECLWMERLQDLANGHSIRWDVPRPVHHGVRQMVRVPEDLIRWSKIVNVHPINAGLVFLAPADYFQYPNDHRHGCLPCLETFQSVIRQNAFLLGLCAAQGCIHTAPIPLFHNRVQQDRRTDHGLYEWHLGGRLDRWLESCRYPNFGPSGLRDFEHFEILDHAGPSLFRAIGSHFLSLLLVAASYFRNREPDLAGLDGSGRPVDARRLFDPARLESLIRDIYSGYCQGFCGRDGLEPPLDLSRLVSRMVEEMGVDHHMVEVLRARDQLAMDQDSFRTFLTGRGYESFEASRLIRGASDLTILTGPHLGGFNQTISLPELVEAVAVMAATCVLERFMALPCQRSMATA